MTDTSGRAIYQRVAADLRSKIVAGVLRVHDTIPSTAELMKQYGISNTAARNAVTLLKQEGVVQGEPGKGVYVIARPDEAAARQASVEDLAHQVSELRAELERLTERVDSGAPDRTIVVEVAEIRGMVEQLYNRLGHPLPNDGSAGAPQRHRATGT